jgi:succinate-acetate transporter protein
MCFGGILILLGGVLEQISGDSLASLAFISLSVFCFFFDVTSLENRVMSDGGVGLSSIDQSGMSMLFLLGLIEMKTNLRKYCCRSF